MSIATRPYQREALDAVHKAAAEGLRRGLVVMPTGAGKTITFAHLIRERGGRAVILAHRDELVRQAVDKLRMVDPTMQVGVVKADEDEVSAPVVVASVQTLARPSRLDRLVATTTTRSLFGEPEPFGTLIVDEVHHYPAGEDGNTFGAVLRGLGAFRDGGPLTVGFTATPDALMAQDGLAGGWQRTVFQLGILDGIAGGWLVDIRAKQVQIAADFRQLHTSGGEIRDEESEQLLLEADAPHHVAQAYLAHARDRKGVVFTPTVLVAHRMAAALRDAGVPAEAVDGAMPMDERRAVLRRLHDGTTQVVPNAQVLTEGWDEPSISAVVMARPTKSRPFALQCIGRGLRPFPGKADCLVLDVVGSAVRQDLMTVPNLFGISQRNAGGGVLQAVLDVQEVAQKAGQAPPQGRLIVRDVALFDRHAFAWVQGSGGDRFILSLGKDGNLILEPCAADPERWDVVQSQRVVVPGAKFPQTVRKRLYTGLDLNLAMGIAEDRVRQAGAQGLNARDARWRHDQPSEKQEAILRKRGRWRDGMSKGEASDLLTSMFAR